jgi:hypothetical protein
MIFLLVLIFRREQIKRNSDISAVRNRKAGKVAVRRLRQAESCLKNAEYDKFYDEILKGLWGYLSDKLSIPVSELTRSNAISVLAEFGIGEQIINNLVSILDTCEYARYAPASSASAPEDIYKKASDFIKSVENKIP